MGTTDGPTPDELTPAQDDAIRSELASLPPLTMPADISVRLSEMINGESAARASGVLGSDVEAGTSASPDRETASAAGASGTAPGKASGIAPVVQLDDRRRPRWRTAVPALAGAAAAIVVGGVVVTQVVSSPAPDVVSEPAPSVVTSADAVAGTAPIAPSPTAPGSAEPQAWQASTPTLIASRTNYRSTTMASQVSEQLKRANDAATATASASLRPAEPEDQANSFLASAESVRACMEWIRRPEATVLMVDLARYEDAPAAVVAVDPDAPDGASANEAEVWVLKRECASAQAVDDRSAASPTPPASPLVTVSLR